MTLPNGSASSVERTMACPASLVLPQVRRGSSEWADRGTALHRFVRAVITGTPREHALAALDPAERTTAERIDFARFVSDLKDLVSEPAYAIDIRQRAVRFLGLDIGRDYERFGITLDEIGASLDIRATRILDDLPCVLDLKFGWEKVTPTEDNAQIKTYALALAWAHGGATDVEGRVVQFDAAGEVSINPYVFTALELDAFADDLEQAIDRVRAAERVVDAGRIPDVGWGSHCRWCEAMSSCPAHVTLARAMLSESKELVARIAMMTIAECGQAWTKAKLIESLLENVFEALKARAVQEPLPTTYGKEARPLTFMRNEFDKAAAIALCRELGATSEQLASLYHQVRVEQIRELNVPGRSRAKAKKSA